MTDHNKQNLNNDIDKDYKKVHHHKNQNRRKY